MNKLRYEERREKLRGLLRREKLTALLVSLDANRFYCSGFELQDHQVNESAGYLVITRDGPDWLCTDSRYHTAACRLWDAERVLIYTANAASEINSLIKTLGSGPTGFESKCLNVHFYQAVSADLAMQPADGLIESLRAIKEPEEIVALEAACAINHKLMEWVPGALALGRTEHELAWDVERFFREQGADALSFPSITAVGPNAALPHAVPGADAITENCCVLVDVGCRLNGYCSDQTRTFWVGNKPAVAFLRTLEQVRMAQKKAMAVMRPGLPVADAYKAARVYFEDQGVAAHFTHSLGHGIGLQTHEGPSLSPRSDAVLQKDMVVTVEPGLYYPEWGGVRWEYMVLITEDGCRVL